jgi:hypothetical protein
MQQREFLGYMNHHLAQQLKEDDDSEGAVLNALNRQIGQTTGKVLAAISKAIAKPGLEVYVERDEKNGEPVSIATERHRFEVAKHIIHTLRLEKMTVELKYCNMSERNIVAITSNFALPVHKHVVRSETLVIG